MKKYYYILIIFVLLAGCILSVPEAQASDSAVLAKQALLSQTTQTKVVSKTELIKQKKVIDKSALIKQKFKFSKKVGTIVKPDEVIGYEGGIPGACGAGNSTGPHLHFEMRNKSGRVNPNDYLGKGYNWPLAKYRITQNFGEENQTPWYKIHTGIDMTLNYGAQVRASAGGRIIFNGISNGYGHLIIIDHRNGFWSYYGHLVCS